MKTLILNWWYRRLRRIDLEILWPTCRQIAYEPNHEPDLDRAKAVFACHAFKDPAWLWLGESEIYKAIDSLK